MPIGPASGFLDFTNATPRANVIVALSNIGIGTDVPLHALDLRGTANVADIIINNDLTLTGGLTTNTLTINNVSMSTTSNFQQVTNVGNVTTNTVEFTNPTTGLAVTSNAEVGGELSVSGNVEVGTANLFVDTTTGNVGVGTTLPSHQLTTPGRVRIGPALSFADGNANHVKCMKYFGSDGHWLVATGSYTGSALEWLSVKAIAARLNSPPREMSLNIVASGDVFNVNDVRIVGNDKNYNNELLVFKKTSDSTYYVYASVDSASTWTFDITHRNSTIDEDGSTFVAGTLDTTDLTAVSNTATDVSFSYIDGNVGVGTAEPQANLDVVTSSTSSGVVMRIDASSITNTGYSEIQMTGPGGNNQQLSIFCNGSGRTADGGASATKIRNNIGPIILGHSSYVNRIRRPKDDDFICGKWTTTLDASASTTVITNLRSCVSTPAATGGNMSGNIGRFTAPEDGYYYACCQVVQATKNNSNLLIVYDANGTNFATNNPNIGTYDEIIDLRGVDNVEETYNKVFVMHMEQDDYIQFRVHSSGYTDSSTYKMQCYAYLLNRI
jgi:hypothetical protein